MPNRSETGPGGRRLVNRAIALVGSLELTTIGLAWMFILVLAGTFYQLGHSIAQTVSVFFHSWFVLLGPVPLPAGQFVFAVLALNLVVSAVTRIPFRWSSVGLFIIHIGLIAMAVGGLTQRFSRRESVLVLAEGESDSYGYDLHRWELVVDSEDRYDIDRLPLEIDGRAVELLEYHADAIALSDGPETVRNIERNRSIEPADPPRENPVPGVILRYGAETVLLYGNDRFPTRVPGDVQMRLEPGRHAISAEIRLDDFTAEFFSASDTPKSFTSRVTVIQDGSERQAVVSMNKPLRLRDHTVYQLGYDAGAGRDISVFQVVRNPLRWVTYAVSLVISGGLLVHFGIRLANLRRRNGV